MFSKIRLEVETFDLSSVQFSRSVPSDSLQPHGLRAACQASLFITNSRILLKLPEVRSSIYAQVRFFVGYFFYYSFSFRFK